MSSYLSNLLTQTTSRYNSLRRNLLDNEADGDTEDDTHLSRVLRAYYTEKGRPFPPWLPPDPKAPQQVPAQFVSSSGRQPGQQAIGRGGGLSDLWDAPQQPQQQEPSSLRRAQGRGGGPRFQGRLAPATSYSPEPQAEGRPLPSQRAGSYQSATSFGRPAADPSPPPSSGGGTAQERLKARLWGSGRSNSPVQSSSASSSPAQSASWAQPPSRTPYERANSNPSSTRSSAPYPDDRGGYSSGGGGGGGGSSGRNPYVSANSPWSTGDDGYGGGGGGGGGGYGAPRQSGRERVGLPNGPRLR